MIDYASPHYIARWGENCPKSDFKIASFIDCISCSNCVQMSKKDKVTYCNIVPIKAIKEGYKKVLKNEYKRKDLDTILK